MALRWRTLLGLWRGRVRLPLGVNSAVQKRTEIKFAFKKTIKQQKMHNSKLTVSGNLATGNCKETTVFQSSSSQEIHAVVYQNMRELVMISCSFVMKERINNFLFQVNSLGIKGGAKDLTAGALQPRWRHCLKYCGKTVVDSWLCWSSLVLYDISVIFVRNVEIFDRAFV